ncbi:MAG: NAD(P)-binding domain-containing protein [Actinomycetota bacterium]|nr:NAD(P)-binding domain-containing protein [Actinomycetota bacterium]
MPDQVTVHRIAVLGTGRVGTTLAQAFARSGYEVVIGSRDPAALDEERRGQLGEVPVAALAEAVAGADVVVDALPGEHAVEVVSSLGDLLDGVVVLDVANALDTSRRTSPTLLVKDTDSLAEQIQRACPRARVVKSLNTVNAAVMVDPGSVGDGDTTVFVAGDDPAARELVAGLLTELGWRDVLDLGDLTAARGIEMWLPLWIRLMQTLGTAQFNLRIVR